MHIEGWLMYWPWILGALLLAVGLALYWLAQRPPKMSDHEWKRLMDRRVPK